MNVSLIDFTLLLIYTCIWLVFFWLKESVFWFCVTYSLNMLLKILDLICQHTLLVAICIMNSSGHRNLNLSLNLLLCIEIIFIMHGTKAHRGVLIMFVFMWWWRACNDWTFWTIRILPGLWLLRAISLVLIRGWFLCLIQPLANWLLRSVVTYWWMIHVTTFE